MIRFNPSYIHISSNLYIISKSKWWRVGTKISTPNEMETLTYTLHYLNVLHSDSAKVDFAFHTFRLAKFP